jgi:Fe-S-cluster-containing dehydrogenase component
MKKWNMIIDVAECTNCNLCTLAAMDEYAGNEWPGYSAPMPKHGHKWINILQKETRADADDRRRLRADHVQSLR